MRRWLLSRFSAERLEIIGLWLIIVGLVGEAALVVVMVPPELIPAVADRALTIVSTLAIALGVWLENVGAAAISGEKDARIAEANARALEAQVALEKFRKPWELPPWKLPEFEKLLGPFAGTPFTIHVIDNIDQRQMAATLRQAFSWARWEPCQSPAPKTLGPGIVDVPPWVNGVDIRINDTKGGEWREAADAIAGVFALAEIDATVQETNGVQPDAIHIFIGRKI